VTLPLVDHIGVLVFDLDAAVARWEAVLGYRFSPVGRYRTESYVDLSDPCPHRHDVRFVLSYDGPPRIELLEVTGSGTHGPNRVGVHHLALIGHQDLETERSRLTSLGLEVDGENTDDQGRLLLFFAGLDGVPLELVSALPGPTVTENGEPLPVDPATGRRSVLLLPETSEPRR
jgi:catechol 2,3-dioxygenase-like lactoylglutathione lyase family enzyme